MPVLVRPLRPAEVDVAVAWAAREGWDPGLHDAAAFRAQDEGGFLGLFVDGEMAASISVVSYGPDFAFLGFYICRPDLRGRGHGFALWRAGLARLGHGPDGETATAGAVTVPARTVGLDGVVAEQGHYASSGFVPAHRNIRYGGPAPSAGAPALRPGLTIVPVSADRVAAVAGYDLELFRFPRFAFLAAWLAPPDGLALAAEANGRIVGYGVIRRTAAGFKIGPLFADDTATADRLFTRLAAHADGGRIFLDVPEPNAAARALAEEAGLVPVFETARMYKGPPPALPLARIFGITTFELG
ncbi:GNAT family N-acetyltransferase [Segnochrobactrum spirostomi]|uniref:GNAT family N-acetyltransferase n=1 Tax=Segnochrobactrum spirostomi TaxID=2608987 RepID=A0A6A7Y1B3_9HYPH|nr:GNAT family N-acetyltransferase [Segnochrobactrum spirostomi]MQT12198.1 GNAT family N-acetyltransferase [Segnochrobactrum spirostomi]